MTPQKSRKPLLIVTIISFIISNLIFYYNEIYHQQTGTWVWNGIFLSIFYISLNLILLKIDLNIINIKKILIFFVLLIFSLLISFILIPFILFLSSPLPIGGNHRIMYVFPLTVFSIVTTLWLLIVFFKSLDA